MASNANVAECGSQIRLPGSRRRVGPGIARRERFRQKSVQRFDADYLFKVREHSAGRNRAVAQLLGIFSFLRNCGVIPKGAVSIGIGLISRQSVATRLRTQPTICPARC